MAGLLLNVPLRWTNQDIILYHGTTRNRAQQIQESGANPMLGRERTDFGRGFYTTTSYRQACSWAVNVAARVSAAPAIVTITFSEAGNILSLCISLTSLCALCVEAVLNRINPNHSKAACRATIFKTDCQ